MFNEVEKYLIKAKYDKDIRKIISNLYKGFKVNINYNLHCQILGDSSIIDQIFYKIFKNYDHSKTDPNDNAEKALEKYILSSFYKELKREATKIINSNKEHGNDFNILENMSNKEQENSGYQRKFNRIRINRSLTKKELEFLKLAIKYLKTPHTMQEIAKEMKISLSRVYYIKKNVQNKQENKRIDSKQKRAKCPVCGEFFKKAKQAKYCSRKECIKLRNLERSRAYRIKLKNT